MDYPKPVMQFTLIKTLAMFVKIYPSLQEYAIELLRNEERVQKMMFRSNWRLRLYWDWQKRFS